jgi:mannose-6-phosphate isomerase-like protein (cupin superfamily)
VNDNEDLTNDVSAGMSHYQRANRAGCEGHTAHVEGSGGISRQGRSDDHGGVSAGRYGPDSSHNAHAFLYVLEGSVVMQLKDGKEVTLKPGQTFYEGPNDIHTVGRNASSTKPAKFIVFLVKDKGAPVLVPVDPTAAGVSGLP